MPLRNKWLNLFQTQCILTESIQTLKSDSETKINILSANFVCTHSPQKALQKKKKVKPHLWDAQSLLEGIFFSLFFPFKSISPDLWHRQFSDSIFQVYSL